MADTQTYGVRATTSLPLATGVKLNLAASHASQSDWKQTPVDYAADYIAIEGGEGKAIEALSILLHCKKRVAAEPANLLCTNTAEMRRPLQGEISVFLHQH